MATEFLKSRASFDNRYRLAKVHQDDFVAPGRRRYGVWSPPEIDMTDYDLHLVTSIDVMRIDLIAYKWYGSSSLWWAICWVNEIENPFEIQPGTVLKIPKVAAISQIFSGTVN